MKQETKEALKELKRNGSLDELRDSSLEEWKNVCVDKMIRSTDMKPEDMGVLASELKYGVKAIGWLFNLYVENNIEPKKKAKVDREYE